MSTAEIASVLASNVRASLTVEQNERRTKRLRKQFSDFFRAVIE